MVRSIFESKDSSSAAKAKKIQRIRPTIDERSKREYRAKRFESKNRYDVQRSQPRLVEVVRNALAGNLDQDFDRLAHQSATVDP